MKRLTAAKLDAVESLVTKKSERTYQTVFGIVCPKSGFLYSLKYDSGDWIKTLETPDVYIAAKLERVLKSKKRFVGVFGGRGSGKSVQLHDIAIAGVKDLGDKVYCLREFQNSLEDSVHSLITKECDRLKFEGFSTQNNIIFHESGGEFKFKGLARNPASIKSAHGFRRFIVEEAQTISDDSLKHLTPTARNEAKAGLPVKFNDAPEQEEEPNALANVQLIFIANPASSADPLSKKFITPFQEHLDRDGFYEDDLHLIVIMNYDDNPWFEDSGLEAERAHDESNLPPATYKHIWGGGFNDHVDNALIPTEWFNAAIDAHIKLGFDKKGAIITAHDPSDQGPDPKGQCIRHGSVITSIREIMHQDAFDGCTTALNEAFDAKADQFGWDGDGLGATLRNHITNVSAGKRLQLFMFKGSESVDNPDAVYSFENKGVPIRDPKTNKDTFKNKRSQYYWALRDRFYNTYRAVVRGEYIDPDQMISLSTDGIENIDKLRSEVCRIPLKPNNNGYIQIMSKIEMKALKIPSPNMADALMMSFANPAIITQNTPQHQFRPQPLRVMGRR